MGLRLRRLLALAPAGLLVAGLAATAVSAAEPGRSAGSSGSSGSSGASGSSGSAGASGSSGPTTATTAPGPLQVVHGGTVTVAVPYLPSTLNPASPAGANPVAAEIMSQVWPSTFVTVGPGDTRASTTFIDAAENVSVSPQRVVYTIDAKARWSDGTPITGADFIAEWHAQLALGQELPANDPLAGYEDIASITSSSAGKVVTVTFKRPDAEWEALFHELAPAQVAAQYGWSAGFTTATPSHLLSGGPFAVARVVPGKELVLRRNPHWWGRAPMLDQIVFRVVHGQGALLHGLEQGTIDVAQVAPGPSLRNALMQHRFLGAQTYASSVLWQLDFNLADPLVGQLAVRRAVATAVDRPELVADSIGLQRNGVPLSGNHLYQVGAPGSAGNDGDYGLVDVPLADQLLASAGYRLDASGILRSASGAPLVLRLVVPSSGQLVSQMTAELRAQLLDAGIVVHVVRVPLARLLSGVLPTGAYQVALVPEWVSAYPSENATYYVDPVGPQPTGSPFTLPPAPGTTTSTSTTTTTTLPASTTKAATTAPQVTAYAPETGTATEPGAVAAGSVTRDVLGYRDPALETLLAQAFSALNPGQAASLYDQADRVIWSDLPSLPLYQVPTALVGERALYNLFPSSTWLGPLWDAQNWVLEVPAGSSGASGASGTAPGAGGPSGATSGAGTTGAGTTGAAGPTSGG